MKWVKWQTAVLIITCCSSLAWSSLSFHWPSISLHHPWSSVPRSVPRGSCHEPSILSQPSSCATRGIYLHHTDGNRHCPAYCRGGHLHSEPGTSRHLAGIPYRFSS